MSVVFFLRNLVVICFFCEYVLMIFVLEIDFLIYLFSLLRFFCCFLNSFFVWLVIYFRFVVIIGIMVSVINVRSGFMYSIIVIVLIKVMMFDKIWMIDVFKVEFIFLMLFVIWFISLLCCCLLKNGIGSLCRWVNNLFFILKIVFCEIVII